MTDDHPIRYRRALIEVLRAAETLGTSSTEPIAKELFLSKATIDNHWQEILRLLGAHKRWEARVKARELGILESKTGLPETVPSIPSN